MMDFTIDESGRIHLTGAISQIYCRSPGCDDMLGVRNHKSVLIKRAPVLAEFNSKTVIVRCAKCKQMYRIDEDGEIYSIQ